MTTTLEKELVQWLKDKGAQEKTILALVNVLAAHMTAYLHGDKRTLMFLSKRFLLAYCDAAKMIKDARHVCL